MDDARHGAWGEEGEEHRREDADRHAQHDGAQRDRPGAGKHRQNAEDTFARTPRRARQKVHDPDPENGRRPFQNQEEADRSDGDDGQRRRSGENQFEGTFHLLDPRIVTSSETKSRSLP